MAETRDTQVLEDVVESIEIENPRTTEEAILAKIIAGEEVNINARTRYQAYLKELGSISGGNPNYVETITGTLANPWGEHTYSELRTLHANGNASFTLALSSFPNTLYYPALKTALGFNRWFGDVSFADNTSKVTGIIYLNSGAFSKAAIHDYSNETYTETNIDSSTACILTIIHHPLPEDNT